MVGPTEFLFMLFSWMVTFNCAIVAYTMEHNGLGYARCFPIAPTSP